MTHSLFYTESRRTYAAQRGVSQGATITLTANCSGYVARFECATKAAQVLGDRSLIDYGTPPESIPQLAIPTEDLHRSITKLSHAFSVALVDTVTDDQGTRFALVWKISASKPLVPINPYDGFPEEPELQTVNQDAALNLDEY